MTSFESNFLLKFCITAVAGTIAKTLMAPIERIKILRQCQNEISNNRRDAVIGSDSDSEEAKLGMQESSSSTQSSSSDSSLSKCSFLPENAGYLQILKFIVFEEGFFSLWRGNLANLCRYVPMMALTYGFKGEFDQLLANTFEINIVEEPIWLQSFYSMLKGGLSAIFATSICYSLDFCRTQLANDVIDIETGQRRYQGITDVYKKTIKTDGISGLYRGFGVSVIGCFFYRGLFFAISDPLKYNFLAVDPETNNFIVNDCIKTNLTVLCISVISNMIAGTLVYPLDTVKRRMMMTTGFGTRGQGRYGSLLDALKSIIKNEGVSRLFLGWEANCLRSVCGGLTDYFTESLKEFATTVSETMV